MSLLKGRKKLPPSLAATFPEKYPGGHGIKPKKLEDLQRMLPFIPQESRQFYLDLFARRPPSTSGDSSDESDCE